VPRQAPMLQQRRQSHWKQTSPHFVAVATFLHPSRRWRRRGGDGGRERVHAAAGMRTKKWSRYLVCHCVDAFGYTSGGVWPIAPLARRR